MALWQDSRCVQVLPYDKRKLKEINGNRRPIDPDIAQQIFCAPPDDAWSTIEQYHREYPDCIFIATQDRFCESIINTGRMVEIHEKYTYRRTMYKFVRNYHRLFPKDYSVDALKQFAHKVMHHIPGIPIRPSTAWADFVEWGKKHSSMMHIMPWRALRVSYDGGPSFDLSMESYYMFPVAQCVFAFDQRLPGLYCYNTKQMFRIVRALYGTPTEFPLHDGKLCCTKELNKILHY